MFDLNTKALVELSALNCEVEAMKVANVLCAINNSYPQYDESNFENKAYEIRVLLSKLTYEENKK